MMIFPAAVLAELEALPTGSPELLELNLRVRRAHPAVSFDEAFIAVWADTQQAIADQALVATTEMGMTTDDLFEALGERHELGDAYSIVVGTGVAAVGRACGRHEEVDALAGAVAGLLAITPAGNWQAVKQRMSRTLCDAITTGGKHV